MEMEKRVPFLLLFFLLHHSLAALLSDPAQPLNPADYPSPNTVPAFPSQQQQQQNQSCHLDLSDELFGGVQEACGGTLDRSRCCPVLAAWLFAAHARTALEVSAAPSPANDLPMIPDDSQKCVDSLENSLESRKIEMTRPNATCDTTICFCRIRLHQITSLSCPAAFNVSNGRNTTPTAAVRDLEKSCRNSSYAGCSKCLGGLEKVTDEVRKNRTSEMLRRDCRLMGLTWLLARNKTEYIPTVSAVLRAIMYGGHPSYDDSKCSPDQENMPLAVDSLQFQTAAAAFSPPRLLLPYCYFFFLLLLLL